MSLGKSKSKAPSPFNKEQGICRDASGAVIPCEEGGLVRKKASPPNEGGGPEETAENEDMFDSPQGPGHIHTGQGAGESLVSALVPGMTLWNLLRYGPGRADHPSSFKHEGRIIDPSSPTAGKMKSRDQAQRDRDDDRRKKRTQAQGAPSYRQDKITRSGAVWV
jgi:hypothetical protein